MTSQKQIEANRKNAQKSTGPVSVAGKEIVARNAVRHGILSANVFIDEGEQKIYDNFCDEMFKNLKPQSGFENFLVDRIISTAWRMRRIVCIEAMKLEKANKYSYGDSYTSVFVAKSADSMAVLSRYEQALEKTFYRALRELKAMQESCALEIVASGDQK